MEEPTNLKSKLLPKDDAASKAELKQLEQRDTIGERYGCGGEHEEEIAKRNQHAARYQHAILTGKKTRDRLLSINKKKA